MTVPRQDRRPLERRATDVRVLEDRLNDLLERGRLLEAYGRYYLDAAVTRRVRSGPAAEAWVLRFLQWAERFVAASPMRSMVSGPASYSVWAVRANATNGLAFKRRVAREWWGGRVVRERIDDFERESLVAERRSHRG